LGKGVNIAWANVYGTNVATARGRNGRVSL
jgi:hypothetical protein